MIQKLCPLPGAQRPPRPLVIQTAQMVKSGQVEAHARARTDAIYNMQIYANDPCPFTPAQRVVRPRNGVSFKMETAM